MADEKQEATNQKAPSTLTDDQILTGRKVPRRSFLSTTGMILAGGAAAIVAGKRALAQDQDSDAKPEKKEEKEGKNDPDKKKGSDPDKKKKSGKKSKKSEKAPDSDTAKP